MILMIFSSNKSGGYGGEDLWFSKKQDNGTNGQNPVNMGPNINSSYDEISPFIHPDGVTLFYSSNSDKSIGGYDVFVSTKKISQINLWPGS